jgi:hypothetical protein
VAHGSTLDPVKGAWAILGGLVLALALSVPVAQAAATRAEYVAQAEPLCKATSDSLRKPAKKFVKGLKKATPKHKPKRGSRAAKRYARRVFRVAGGFYLVFGRKVSGLQRQLVVIPPPAADAAVLNQWLGSMSVASDAMIDIATRLRSRSLKKALGAANEIGQIDKGLKATDSVVSGFGFQQCLFFASAAPTI